MALTNAQRQKQYRDRLKARGLTPIVLEAVPPETRPSLRRLGRALRQAGPGYAPLETPITQGEAAVLLQVLQSIRGA